ncbi:MAG: hypothetical protein HY286_15500 [Planctomycetes bacterium]|nr:hypothetical protein [Planctomycetota bacterium]
MNPARRAAAIDLIFAAAVAAILTILAACAAARDGSRDAMLTWDSAAFVTQAITMKREIAANGIGGFVNAWMHTSGTHAPLVPMASAIWMFLFGESRAVAESVLPVFMFIFVLSTVRAAKLIFKDREDIPRWLPYAIAAHLVTFPAALNLSRMYVYEFPLAAMVAAASWAALATQQFTRAGRTLLFGAVAGLACVARAGGAVLLAGPALVVFAHARRHGPRAAKIINILIGGAIAAALALSWYGPNLRELSGYFYSVTYGDRSSLYAGAGGSFSWENIKLTMLWSIYDGAGVPAASIGLIAGAVAFAERRRLYISKLALALCFVYLIDFALVSLASQRKGGTLLISVMAVQAMLVWLAAAAVRTRALRILFMILLGACGAHSAYDLTFSFELNGRSRGGVGPFGEAFPLWNHRNLFVALAGKASPDPAWPRRMRDLCDELERAPLPPKAAIYLLTDNAFFQSNNLQLEAVLRGHDWWVQTLAWMPPEIVKQREPELQKLLAGANVIIHRATPDVNKSRYDEMVEYLMHYHESRLRPWFYPASAPLDKIWPLEMYIRVPDIEWVDVDFRVANHPDFRDPANANATIQVMTTGMSRETTSDANGSVRNNEFHFEVTIDMSDAVARLPEIYIHIFERDGTFVSSRTVPELRRPADLLRPTDRRRAKYIFDLEGAMPPRLPARGYDIGVSIGGDAPSKRWTLINKTDTSANDNISIVHTVEPEVASRPAGK